MQHFRVALMASAIGTLCMIAPAHAQTTAAETSASTDSTGIADIVVTAERREQSTQRSALSIQVVGGEALEKAGVSAAGDLTKLTTGVEIGVAGANSQIYVRGVGSFAYIPLQSPGVAFNVDGVYVGRPDSVAGNFYDIARIEVLKGPQGTLYGRNANGGSINLVTNDPRIGERSMDLNLEGGNYSLAHASGAINLPIGEHSALRAAFNVVQRDGYLSDGTFDDKQQAARIRFKTEPNENLTIVLNADYAHTGGRGGNATWRPRRPGADPYESITEPAAQAYKHSFPGSGLAPFTNTDRNDGYQDNQYYNLSAQVDLRLGFATLTLLPAYRHSDIDYLTYDLGARYRMDKSSSQTSLEARLGNKTGNLTWVIGGYYFHETQDGFYDITPGDVPVPFFGGAVLLNQRIAFKPKTDAYAAFGQATLGLAPGFRLIAGARYTHEKASVSGTISNLTPAALLSAYSPTGSFDGTTFKAGFEYDLAPQSMLYATYSTGFKAGGLNQTPTPAIATFRPEKLNSAEVGIKNRFLDNKLQINVSAYHWKYKNLQDARAAFDAFGVNFITFNSGDATIYGATLDIIAKPWTGGTFNFSGEYAHSKYDRFLVSTPTPLFLAGSTGCPTTSTGPGGLTTADCSGFQVARVPKWTFTAGYDHEFLLADGGSVNAGASVKYSSARWIGIDFVAAQRDDAYAVVDANISYTTPDSRLTVGLFGRNLTKSVYYTGGVATTFIPGLFAANIGAPRTYGARLSAHF
ncbi:TonB-dependent receptor [Novosphingobium cyanobacteriorum]|uniref:TonB-dependent receptor n=1 Tax=Novosphingobium cyanobacteriorum TaxID=3024215 RepID=A0ABT6CE24_9SPHN|nr:TonB-dependent receptor [Novosphingobium cyanobacteriorum]MDF8332171.1 TonB-dependent receptor [Novosphingobium cyanobacteriorum]